MPTLSIVRTDFKKILKWGGIALAVLISLFILFKILIAVKNIILPPSAPVATATFGKLKEPDFPNSVEKDFDYEIDTLSGDLPNLASITNVYKMEQRGPDILAVEKASKNVEQLGFNYNPQQISDYVYKWTEPNPPNKVLVEDIRLNDVNLTSSFIDYEDRFKDKSFRSEKQIIEEAANFLKTLGFYPDDVDEEKTKIDFAKLENGAFQGSNKINGSNIATVYLFQKDKEGVPIVYPQGDNSSMKIVLGAGRFSTEVVEASFSNQKILDEVSTYPIKTAGQAFDDLKNKKAFVLSHSGDGNHVKIKEVYLALYSAGKLQDYLTPVIVFKGDNNFLAYVPAITDEWTDN